MLADQESETVNAPSLDDVAVLALDAAVEIEKLLGGGQADRQVVDTFAAALEGSAGLVGVGGRMRLLSDPAAAAIYGRAISRANGVQVATLDQLNNEVLNYIRIASPVDGFADGSRLGDLKRFCLSLHEVLVSECCVSERMSGSEGEYDRSAVH